MQLKHGLRDVQINIAKVLQPVINPLNRIANQKKVLLIRGFFLQHLAKNYIIANFRKLMKFLKLMMTMMMIMMKILN